MIKYFIISAIFVVAFFLAAFQTNPIIVFSHNFDNDSTGPYTSTQLAIDFNSPKWSNGVNQGRVSIVEGKEAYTGKSLKIKYPANTFGPDDGGAQWNIKLDQQFQELYCSYRVKFSPGFEFVKGGKLPGLAGGKGNTGGHPSNGLDGWSARLMWKQDGKIIQYVYYPDQKGKFGDTFYYMDETGGTLLVQPGVWYLIENHIVMNTPGKTDGLIEAWVDGKKGVSIPNLRFRDTNAFGIDLFQFSTFFGGGDDSWSSLKDEYIYFDDFIISQQSISRSPK